MKPWEKFQRADGPWTRYQPVQPVTVTEPEKPRFVDRLKENTSNAPAVGVAENALTMATGGLGQVAAGWAGMGAELMPGGKTGAEMVETVQDALTYQPRSQSGQAINRGLSQVGEVYERGADKLGWESGEPTDTVGATAVKTALLAAPMMLGLRAGRGGRLTTGSDKPPTVKQLKQQASDAYDAADNAGVIISRQSFGPAVERIRQRLAKEAIDKTLHPDSMAALNRLMQDADKNLSFAGADTLRQVINDAASSTKPADRRMAKIMRDEFDSYMDGLSGTDVIAGNPAAANEVLTRARDAYSRAKKGEEIERLIDRAQTRSQQYTGSGYENALRTEFRQLSMNDKKMRRFTPGEQAAIKAVAEGGPIGNALRRLGSFAVRGPVQGVSGLVAEGVLPGAGLALWGAGEAGRLGATVATSRRARMAAELMRRGGKSKNGGPSAKQLAIAATLAEKDQP